MPQFNMNGDVIDPTCRPKAPQLYRTSGTGGLIFSTVPSQVGMYVYVTVSEAAALYHRDDLEGLANYMRDLARRLA